VCASKPYSQSKVERERDKEPIFLFSKYFFKQKNKRIEVVLPRMIIMDRVVLFISFLRKVAALLSIT
jgi:hypothetical protein